MGRYLANHRYRSGPHSFDADAVVELDDETAAWVNRDSPGCLSPEGEQPDEDEPAEPEPQPEDEPDETSRRRGRRPAGG